MSAAVNSDHLTRTFRQGFDQAVIDSAIRPDAVEEIHPYGYVRLRDDMGGLWEVDFCNPGGRLVSPS